MSRAVVGASSDFLELAHSCISAEEADAYERNRLADILADFDLGRKFPRVSELLRALSEAERSGDALSHGLVWHDDVHVRVRFRCELSRHAAVICLTSEVFQVLSKVALTPRHCVIQS